MGRLKELGIPVQTFDDYTGCIATIEGGTPGRTVVLRADIDALPIEENSGVEFESIHPVSYTHLDVYKRQMLASVSWLK